MASAPGADSTAIPSSQHLELTQLFQMLANAANAQAQTMQVLAARVVALEQRVAEMQHTLQTKLERVPAGGRFAAYLGNHVALGRILNRYRMYVDTRDLGITPHILSDGIWEMEITHAIERMLKPGMAAMDIGANMGFFTLVMAGRVGPTGKVFAVEPDPENFELLRRSVELNGFQPWTEVLNLAAFNQRSELTLFKDPSYVGGASVLGEMQSDHRRKITVPAVPLDEIVHDRIDVIKMDAEGSEPYILQGMRELIRRSPDIRILMEFGLGWDRGPDLTPAKFLQWIREELQMEYQLLQGDASIVSVPDEVILNGPSISTLVLQHRKP